MIIKIIKFIGIAFVIFLIIYVIAFCTSGKLDVESSATTVCKLNNKQYEIEFGTDKYFKCENCTEEMNNEIKNLVNFNNIDSSMKNVENYFKSKNGSCE